MAPGPATAHEGVDWYFDVISPFAYLQWVRLGELPGPPPRLRPVLFAGLLGHWGQLGPAEIPAKRTFTYRHALWRARAQDTPLRFPPAHPFNPLAALRLIVACGSSHDVVAAVFDFIWKDGRDPGADWPDLCARVGMSAGDALARIDDPAVKAGLRGNTEAAIAAGVFGVPTLVAAGELFWGVDATDMASGFLRDPESLRDPEMVRLGTLPAAVQRPRNPGP